MRRSTFNDPNNLSNIIPDDMRLYNVNSAELAQVTVDFLSENFGGLFELDYQPGRSGNVLVSVDGITYFLRQLITAAKGIEVIRLTIREEDSKLRILTSFGYKSFNSSGSIAEIIRTVKDAGFRMAIDKNGNFEFYTAIEKERDIIFRAVSFSAIRTRFYLVFFGPPLPFEAKPTSD